MSKELECLKRIDTKNYLTEREHREFYSVVEQALLELKSIKEANPSEALKCLEYLYCNPEDYRSNDRVKDYATLKGYILKAQERKRYLKWKDLEFNYGTKEQKVKMGDTIYKIVYSNYDNTNEVQLFSEDEKLLYFSFVGKYKDNVQLFNDLHLEVVE